MEPQFNSTKDNIRCNLCNINNAQNYCNICSVSLCKHCIGDHISDEYDNHKVVSMQERVSALLYPTCKIHSNKTCHSQCQLCSVYICVLCVASKEHKGHTFKLLEDIFTIKKLEMETDTKEIEKDITPKYAKIKNELINQIESLDEDYEKITTVISEQGMKLHAEVDGVVNKMKNEITEIKKEHRLILEKDLNEIKLRGSLIERDILDLKELKKSKNASAILTYRGRNKQIKKLPPKVHITLPKFCPTPINRKMLCKMFGSIKPLLATRDKNRHGLFGELFNIPNILNVLIYLIQNCF